MQDPTSRRYDPSERWTGSEGLLNAESFVIAPCHERLTCGGCDRKDAMDLEPHDDSTQHDHCSDPGAHGRTILVAIAGTCQGEGTADATATCGVFFNTQSVHNKAFSPSSAQLHNKKPTPQRAELCAAIVALETFESLYTANAFGEEGSLVEVVIKTDSSDLYRGITEWIADWRINGYTMVNGEIMPDKRFFQRLDELCNKFNDRGVGVRFWFVLPEQNRLAAKLANTVVDGRDWKQFSVDDWFEGDPKPGILQ